MKETEIISKIKSLKKIEPNQDWVSLTKNNIFDNDGLEKQSFFGFDFKNIFARSSMTAFAGLGLIVLIAVSSQASSPGDSLYSIKRLTERGRMMLVSQENKQDFNMLMAHKRLEEISKIIKEDQIEKLSLAVQELEKAKTEMQKDFAKSVESKPRQEAVEKAQGFASNVLEIENEKEMLLGPLGVRVESDEPSSDSSKYLANFLIEDYKERSLTEESELLIEQAEDFFEKKEYRSALETVLQVNLSEEIDIDIDIDIDQEDNENKEKENESNEN